MINWKNYLQRAKYRDYTILLIAFVILNGLLALIATPNHTFKNLGWYSGIGQQMQTVGLFGLWTPYPPLFSLFIYLFAPIANNPDSFFFAWEVLNIAMIFAIGFLSYKIAEKFSKQTALLSAFSFGLINFTITSAISIGFYQDQFDYLPILMMMGSLYMLLNDKPVQSALLSGVGAMTKVMPVIVVPVAWLFLNNRKKIEYSLVFALTCAIAVLPWLIVNPGSLRSFYEFSASRDARKTVWNFPLMKFPPIPLPQFFTRPFHSDVSLYPWLLWLTAAFGLGCLWWQRNEKGERAVPRIMLSLLLVFLIFSTGLSSYYILWLFPLLFVIYKPLYAFALCSALLLVSDIEFIGAPPIQPFPYWVAIWGRHALFAGMLVQSLFRVPSDQSISLDRVATPQLAGDAALVR